MDHPSKRADIKFVVVAEMLTRNCQIVMVVSGVVGFTYFLIMVLQCRPMSAFWKMRRDQCASAKLLGDAAYASSAVNALGNWTFSIIPIFIVRNLDMSKRQKIEVAGLLSLAGL
jgi:hypothetical protein